MAVLPSVGKIASSTNYASDFDLLAFNIDKRTPFQQRASDFDDTMLILTMLGKTRGTPRQTYYHDEVGPYSDAFTLNYASSVSTYVKTYTVDATSVITQNGDYFTAAVDHATIQFPDANNTQGIIDSIAQSGSTFTLTVYFATGTTPPTANGQEVFYVSRQEARGSDLSTVGTFGTFPRRYSNGLTEVFEKFESNGYTFDATWYPVKDDSGKEGFVWQYKENDNLKKRFQDFRVRALLINQAATINDSSGNPYYSGNGLIPYLQQNGAANINYGKGTKSYDDWMKVVRYLDSNGGDMENFVWGGFDATEEDNRWQQNFTKNGAISYGAFQNDPKKAMDYGFDSMAFNNGYTFHKRPVRAFSNPHSLGAGKGLYRSLQIICPALMTNVDGEQRESLEIRYYANGDQDYQYEDYVVGGASSLGIKTNASNNVTRIIRSSEGIEAYGANRFVLFQGI